VHRGWRSLCTGTCHSTPGATGALRRSYPKKCELIYNGLSPGGPPSFCRRGGHPWLCWLTPSILKAPRASRVARGPFLLRIEGRERTIAPVRELPHAPGACPERLKEWKLGLRSGSVVKPDAGWFRARQGDAGRQRRAAQPVANHWRGNAEIQEPDRITARRL
jgi:hypothetical protein